MPDPMTSDDGKKKGKGKHDTRNLLIAGGAALVIGVAWFWWQSRQSAASSGSSGSTAGTSATGGTDMGDVVQTVQGPPGQAGKTGKTGKQGTAGKTAHDCPAGMRWDFARGACVKSGVFGKPKVKRPGRKA